MTRRLLMPSPATPQAEACCFLSRAEASQPRDTTSWDQRLTGERGLHSHGHPPGPAGVPREAGRCPPAADLHQGSHSLSNAEGLRAPAVSPLAHRSPPGRAAARDRPAQGRGRPHAPALLAAAQDPAGELPPTSPSGRGRGVRRRSS